MSGPPHRSWIYNRLLLDRNGYTEEFLNGINQFDAFARRQADFQSGRRGSNEHPTTMDSGSPFSQTPHMSGALGTNPNSIWECSYGAGTSSYAIHSYSANHWPIVCI